MVTTGDIIWFREKFGDRMAGTLRGTPFDVDMLTALACQETGELWSAMRHQGLEPDKIASLCCGDTLDADKGRRAFPRTKAELIAVPEGQAMFDTRPECAPRHGETCVRLRFCGESAEQVLPRIRCLPI